MGRKVNTEHNIINETHCIREVELSELHKKVIDMLDEFAGNHCHLISCNSTNNWLKNLIYKNSLIIPLGLQN